MMELEFWELGSDSHFYLIGQYFFFWEIFLCYPGNISLLSGNFFLSWKYFSFSGKQMIIHRNPFSWAIDILAGRTAIRCQIVAQNQKISIFKWFKFEFYNAAFESQMSDWSSVTQKNSVIIATDSNYCFID